jgi:hypothetical protein
MAPKTVAAQMEVNDYQKRGLSLDGAQVPQRDNKQIDLLTQMRDSLKKLAERNMDSLTPTW